MGNVLWITNLLWRVPLVRLQKGSEGPESELGTNQEELVLLGVWGSSEQRGL